MREGRVGIKFVIFSGLSGQRIFNGPLSPRVHNGPGPIKVTSFLANLP